MCMNVVFNPNKNYNNISNRFLFPEYFLNKSQIYKYFFIIYPIKIKFYLEIRIFKLTHTCQVWI